VDVATAAVAVTQVLAAGGGSLSGGHAGPLVMVAAAVTQVLAVAVAMAVTQVLIVAVTLDRW
jgi:hypothetical protein